MRLETSNRTLCPDQVDDTPLTDLYVWEPFRQFIAATMPKTALYPMDDPLAGFNVMSYGEGEALNWHLTGLNSPRPFSRHQSTTVRSNIDAICARIPTRTMMASRTCCWGAIPT